MKFPTAMMQDSVWTDRLAYVNAEEHYQLHLTGHLPGGANANANANTNTNINTNTNTKTNTTNTNTNINTSTNTNTNTNAKPAQVNSQEPTASPLISEINTMRENIKSSLSGMANVDNPRIAKLEEENKSMRKLIEDLTNQIAQLTTRVEKLEKGSSTSSAPTAGKSAAVSKKDEDDDDIDLFGDEEPAASKKKVDKGDDNDDDDDFDLFGDEDEEEEEETEEEKKKKEEVLQKYHEKKSKKPVLIAKSNIVLFVKPWDDETDMAEMERLVRTIQMDGLVWGSAKLVPVGYGINKLQISCVVEDEKVGSEILIEEISTFEDYVQSVDVAAFNKI